MKERREEENGFWKNVEKRKRKINGYQRKALSLRKKKTKKILVSIGIFLPAVLPLLTFIVPPVMRI